MDKNLHDIEDLFRKELEDNEENPSQNAWDGIEKKLDKENVVSIKKKYNLLRKVTLLLAILLTGLSIYVWKNQDKSPVKPNKDITGINKEAKTKNNTLTEESGTTTLQKPVDSLTINKSDNSKQITESVTTNLKNRVDTLTVNKNNNIKEVTESENRVSDRTILKDDNDNLPKSLNPITAKNLSNTSIPKNKIKNSSPDGSHSSDVSESSASKFSIQKKGKLIKRNSDEFVETKRPKQIEDEQPNGVSHSGIGFDNNLPSIETLNSKDGGNVEKNTVGKFATKELLQNIGLVKINPSTQIEKTIVRKPSIKSTKQSGFAITAFYSPDIAFYHFENNDQRNSNNTDFENSETESYSSTIGALVEYNFSEHWGLQTGITLATTNFQLDSDTIYAEPDNSGQIKYKLRSPLGDAYVLPYFSNSPNIGDSILSKSPTHTLQYLGIPLAVKYNFNKGKFSLNALGGITANFLSCGRISTELESGANSEIETTNKIYGLKPLYFSGLVGIGVDYNIYKKFSISFSPTLRFALSAINSNFNEPSYPISLGFVLGLKMKL